jgi:uncharacterized damage-inducible protein DinB
MPGMPAPVADERDGLLSFLAQQRYVLKVTAFGLTDEQARMAPTVSPLSVGGLVKHVTSVESHWLGIMTGTPEQRDPESYADDFRMGPDETLAGLLGRYDAVAARTEAAVAEIGDLGHPVPIPRGVPWFPQDVDAWSVRWVLLHLIEETARHAGHADIVREGVDGATGFPLLAAAEGWPATEWLQPWEPAGA